MENWILVFYLVWFHDNFFFISFKLALKKVDFDFEFLVADISLCQMVLEYMLVYGLHVFRAGRRRRSYLTWEMLHQVCPFGHIFSSYNHPRGVLRIPSRSSLSLVLSIWAVSFCNHRIIKIFLFVSKN